MKKIIILSCYLTFALAKSAYAQASTNSPPKDSFAPTATTDILFAKPFSLDQGYTHDWSKNRPFVKEGVLVVLKVDPELVIPRNALQPVLYAGNQTVQRLNHGYESGHVIGIIPGRVDLSQIPIWFGEPGLPEQISTEEIESLGLLANNSNIRAFSQAKIKSVLQGELNAENLAELLRKDVAELILEFSPKEKYLADDWRLQDAK